MVDSAAELPRDLIVEILSRLPVKTLLRLKAVCKSWHSLIEFPGLISRHLSRSLARSDGQDGNGSPFLLVKHRCRTTGMPLLSLLSSENLELVFPIDIPHMVSPNLNVVGSCNGVVCLSHDCSADFGASMFFWNPATRESRVLPKCTIIDSGVVVHGFGYHHAIDDYMLVRIAFTNLPNKHCFRAEVFALGEGLWREVPALACRVYSSGCIALNGTLYWVAYSCGSDDQELILSFDLRDEVFYQIRLPDLDFFGEGYCSKLAVYDESLSLIVYNFRGRAKCFDLWVMQGGAGEESWTKRLSMGPVIGIRRPLSCGMKGEIFVEKSNGTLAIFETNSETVRDLPIKGFPYSLDLHCYIESLVPVTR